jgi:hypothetical protein
LSGDAALKIRQLYDQVVRDGEADKASYFLLWTHVAGILPEVKHGGWELDFKHTFFVYVRERP